MGITLLFLDALTASRIRPQSAHFVPFHFTGSSEGSLSISPGRVTQIRMPTFSPHNDKRDAMSETAGTRPERETLMVRFEGSGKTRFVGNGPE